MLPTHAKYGVIIGRIDHIECYSLEENGVLVNHIEAMIVAYVSSNDKLFQPFSQRQLHWNLNKEKDFQVFSSSILANKSISEIKKCENYSVIAVFMEGGAGHPRKREFFKPIKFLQVTAVEISKNSNSRRFADVMNGLAKELNGKNIMLSPDNEESGDLHE